MQKNNEDSESKEKTHSKPKISQSNSGKNQQTKQKTKNTTNNKSTTVAS